MSLSSALVYSTRLRVSVYGTGTLMVMFSGFSWQYDYMYYYVIPRESVYYQVSTQWVDLPAHIKVYTL